MLWNTFPKPAFNVSWTTESLSLQCLQWKWKGFFFWKLNQLEPFQKPVWGLSLKHLNYLLNRCLIEVSVEHMGKAGMMLDILYLLEIIIIIKTLMKFMNFDGIRVLQTYFDSKYEIFFKWLLWMTSVDRTSTFQGFSTDDGL